VYRVLWALGISVLVLLLAGFIVLASAGGENGMRIFGNEHHFLIRQAIWLGISLPCMFAAARIDYHKWRDLKWMTWLVYGVVVVLLVVVLFGPETKGSRRWIGYGAVKLQPSELAKLAVVITTAVYLDAKGWMLARFWKGAFRAAVVVAIPIALVLKEPDFGASFVIGAAGAVLFLVAGMKMLHFLSFAGFGIVVVATMLSFNANRMNRINSWVKSAFQDTSVPVEQVEKAAADSLAELKRAAEPQRPAPAAVATRARAAMKAAEDVLDYEKGRAMEEGIEAVLKNVSMRLQAEPPSFAALRKTLRGQIRSRDKAKAAAHQLDNSLVAIQRGKLAGVGFYESKQKRKYLPEAHTDFIFPIGAEEWGLGFSLGILLCFTGLFACGVTIAARAPDALGRMLAYGMSLLVYSQALFNLGVVTGCLPTKGIALPFISYGGTNLLTAMVAVGFLFNVGRQIGLQTPRSRSKLSPVFSTQGV